MALLFMETGQVLRSDWCNDNEDYNDSLLLLYIPSFSISCCLSNIQIYKFL